MSARFSPTLMDVLIGAAIVIAFCIGTRYGWVVGLDYFAAASK